MGARRIPIDLPRFRKSNAAICTHESVDTIVVFVHGFGGDPASTWFEFEGLAKTCATKYPWLDDSDLFFYSYESLSTPITENAKTLGEFIEYVLSKDAAGERRFPFSAGAKYKRLIFAGHSEGAVLIRRLLLNRWHELRKANASNENLAREAARADFLLNCTLRLFAPACLGTNFSSLLGFAFSLSDLANAIASSSKVRNELLPNSPILRQIEEGTEKVAEELPEVRGFVAKVLFGSRDEVVQVAGYTLDELVFEKDHNHTSICKPTFRFLKPLEFLS
jgi:hypothetical protein